MEIAGSFNLFLVAVSYVVSVFGSFTALVLARESVKAELNQRLPWVLWSAVIMAGIGIWSMHFIGMMAYRMGMPVNYDIGLTTLSMVLAVIATGIGFAVVGLVSRGFLSIAIAGVFMGGGVAGMHYTGMAAMRMAARVDYDMSLVWASLGIAVTASAVALWMAFHLRARWQMTIAALIAGLAVCGMHYTGMAAVRLVPDPSIPEPLPTALSPTVVGSGLFALSVLVLVIGHALTREPARNVEIEATSV